MRNAPQVVPRHNLPGDRISRWLTSTEGQGVAGAAPLNRCGWLASLQKSKESENKERAERQSTAQLMFMDTEAQQLVLDRHSKTPRRWKRCQGNYFVPKRLLKKQQLLDFPCDCKTLTSSRYRGEYGAWCNIALYCSASHFGCRSLDHAHVSHGLFSSPARVSYVHLAVRSRKREVTRASAVTERRAEGANPAGASWLLPTTLRTRVWMSVYSTRTVCTVTGGGTFCFYRFAPKQSRQPLHPMCRLEKHKIISGEKWFKDNMWLVKVPVSWWVLF